MWLAWLIFTLPDGTLMTAPPMTPYVSYEMCMEGAADKLTAFNLEEGAQVKVLCSPFDGARA